MAERVVVHVERQRPFREPAYGRPGTLRESVKQRSDLPIVENATLVALLVSREDIEGLHVGRGNQFQYPRLRRAKTCRGRRKLFQQAEDTTLQVGKQAQNPSRAVRTTPAASARDGPAKRFRRDSTDCAPTRSQPDPAPRVAPARCHRRPCPGDGPQVWRLPLRLERIDRAPRAEAAANLARNSPTVRRCHIATTARSARTRLCPTAPGPERRVIQPMEARRLRGARRKEPLELGIGLQTVPHQPALDRDHDVGKARPLDRNRRWTSRSSR